MAGFLLELLVVILDLGAEKASIAWLMQESDRLYILYFSSWVMKLMQSASLGEDPRTCWRLLIQVLFGNRGSGRI